MPRKTTGKNTPPKKKSVAVVAAQPSVPQPATVQPPMEKGKKAPTSDVSVKKPVVNIDEEIRLRAYELYLQRNGAAGDPNRDWFLAEQEVRARYIGQGQISARAAAQGRS